MNFAKTCLAVLLGVVIGMFVITLFRPQPVKAEGGEVWITVTDAAGSANGRLQLKGGTKAVGISCSTYCFILSQ